MLILLSIFQIPRLSGPALAQAPDLALARSGFQPYRADERLGHPAGSFPLEAYPGFPGIPGLPPGEFATLDSRAVFRRTNNGVSFCRRPLPLSRIVFRSTFPEYVPWGTEPPARSSPVSAFTVHGPAYVRHDAHLVGDGRRFRSAQVRGRGNRGSC